MSDGERLPSDVSVVERNGLVLVGTPDRPMFALDAEAARQMAEALARSSYKARFGVDMVPQGQSAVTRAVREQMVTRVSHIIRSFTEQHKPRIFIAEAVVDAVLAKANV